MGTDIGFVLYLMARKTGKMKTLLPLILCTNEEELKALIVFSEKKGRAGYVDDINIWFELGLNLEGLIWLRLRRVLVWVFAVTKHSLFPWVGWSS